MQCKKMRCYIKAPNPRLLVCVFLFFFKVDLQGRLMSREQALAAAEATAAELRHTCDSLTRKAGNLASALEVGFFFLFFSLS